jgi:hypothetical protein
MVALTKKRGRSRKKEVHRHTVMVEPFDIAMYHTRDGEGLSSLQNRFATWGFLHTPSKNPTAIVKPISPH